MIRIIELPQVGESVTEGVIGKWLVEPGQHVEKYDPLVEVVTDKVSMEAPSPYTGVFVRALAEEGETVPMGQPICEMEVEGEDGSPVIPSAAEGSLEAERSSVVPAEAGTSQPDPTEHLSLEGRGRAEGAGEGEPEADEGAPSEGDPAIDDDAGRVGGAWAMPAAQDGDAQESGEEAGQHAFEFMDSVRSVGPTGSGEGGAGRRDALQEQALAEHEHESAAPSAGAPDRRHVISPLVARLSAQYGIDLSTLQGTGTGGRITSKDLLDAVSRMTAGTQEAEADEPVEEEGHLSLEGRGRAESAGEGEPEEAETVAEAEEVAEQPAPEEAAEDVEEEATDQPLFEEDIEEALDAAEEEAAEVAEAEAEPASPVIPVQAGILGDREVTRAEAAHTEDVGPVDGFETPAEAVADEEHLSLEGRGRAESAGER